MNRATGGQATEGNQDQDNATRIKSRVQNERISLLLILVDPESTVCPGKGRVSRTSYSESTSCPEEGGVLRMNAQPGVKRPRATRIRIMHKNKVPCAE